MIYDPKDLLSGPSDAQMNLLKQHYVGKVFKFKRQYIDILSLEEGTENYASFFVTKDLQTKELLTIPIRKFVHFEELTEAERILYEL